MLKFSTFRNLYTFCCQVYVCSMQYSKTFGTCFKVEGNQSFFKEFAFELEKIILQNVLLRQRWRMDFYGHVISSFTATTDNVEIGFILFFSQIYTFLISKHSYSKKTDCKLFLWALQNFKIATGSNYGSDFLNHEDIFFFCMLHSQSKLSFILSLRFF